MNVDTGRVYKAWVPTVSGALSFGMLGDGAYPERPKKANVGDQKNRYVICSQRRVLLDAIIPVFTRLRGIRGEFTCLCIGKGNDDPTICNDYLAGRLYLFHNTACWRDNCSGTVYAAQKKLKAYPEMLHSNPRLLLADYFDNEYASLLTNCCRSSSFFVDFTLQRNGVCTLEVPPLVEEQVHPDAPSFPSDPIKRERTEHIVCSQLFFFLKDLCHNHQHHPPKADTLVDIHPFSGEELDWRSKTLRFLYRKIIEFKRDTRPSSYNSSLGILIYARSFRALSKTELNMDICPAIQDDLLERSIIAGHQDTSYKLDRESNNRSANVTFLLGFMTVVLTVVLLLSITDYKVDDPDIFLIHIGEIFVKHTLPVLALCYFCYRMFIRRRKYYLLESEALRSVLRVLQPFPQFVVAAALIAIGLAAVAGTIGIIIWLSRVGFGV